MSPLRYVEPDAVPVADNIAISTAPLAIVSAVEPVTSPVCVALDTLAVFAVIADACPLVMVVVSPANAVDEVVPSIGANVDGLLVIAPHAKAVV